MTNSFIRDFIFSIILSFSCVFFIEFSNFSNSSNSPESFFSSSLENVSLYFFFIFFISKSQIYFINFIFSSTVKLNLILRNVSLSISIVFSMLFKDSFSISSIIVNASFCFFLLSSPSVLNSFSSSSISFSLLLMIVLNSSIFIPIPSSFTTLINVFIVSFSSTSSFPSSLVSSLVL